MKKALFLMSLLALSITLGWTQQESSSQEMILSLEDCILHALENNLSLRAEVLTPRVASFAVRRANEIFVPQMSFGYNKRNQRSASYSFIDATENIITEDSNYQAAVSQLLPTGGRLGMNLRSFRQESNRNFLTINPLFGSTLSFTFAQPLLRDFGFKVTRREIIVAQNNRDISENQFKSTLLDTMYSVEEAYWNFVYSMENLGVRREALRLAEDLLDKSTKELEVGMIPPIELHSSRAEVASREAEILQAEAEVQNSQDALRILINLPLDEGEHPPVLVPSDAPTIEPMTMNLEEALSTAWANRPDLASSRIDIHTKKINLTYARNQLLPGLNIEASYWSPGISGTQILYQDNNPLTGIVVGTIPGGPSLALNDAFNFKYKNWYVGLSLEIPLETLVSRAQHAQAKLESEQAAIRMKDMEQQVTLEIQTYLRAVETEYKKIQAYKIARELAEASLAAEEKKLKAGLSTNYTVLQFQRDLATARSNELRALIDYNLARSRLARALGTTLRDRNIEIAGRSED